MDLTSGIVWAILVVVAAALGFIGFWFSLRTLRWSTGVIGFILVIAVTRFGFAHPEYHPANLVDSFLAGVDRVTIALLFPLWHGKVPAPGVAGRWLIAAALLLEYRQLEAWTLRWQAPELDLSAISGPLAATPADQGTPVTRAAPIVPDDSAAGPTTVRADDLAAELRFRLPTMEVRTPAILPGGTRANALASIAESSGVSGAGVLSAIFRLAGLFWPSPRRVRVRTWVESRQAFPGSRITILLEDAKSGTTISTNTVAGNDLNEAASMVAGYIARQIFAMDRTVPEWCYGVSDGRDLGAMQLARLERVYAACYRDVHDSREAQIHILSGSAGIARTAGIVRYELAQLLALQGQHLESLRLHALNRELHYRLYRGRYRLAMSLEMIANPEHYLPDEPDTWDILGDILEILSRCELTDNTLDLRAEGLQPVDVTDPSGQVKQCLRLTPQLADHLLDIAGRDLRDVRKQLGAWRVVRDTLFRRRERAVWLPHWRLRHRRAFRDGVCVAELLVAVRRRRLAADGAPHGRLRRALALWHLWRAVRITSFVAGNPALISAVLTGPGTQWWDRLRRLRWRRRTVSWQAAYNTACVYAALTDAALTDATWTETALADVAVAETVAETALTKAAQALAPQLRAALTNAALADAAESVRTRAALAGVTLVDRVVLKYLEGRVVVSLRHAVDNSRSELERPSDWIDSDPDFHSMRQGRGTFAAFEHFLLDQKKQDYPVAFIRGECQVPHTAAATSSAALARRSASASSRILSPVPGRAAIR